MRTCESCKYFDRVFTLEENDDGSLVDGDPMDWGYCVAPAPIWTKVGPTSTVRADDVSASACECFLVKGE
jgi:hypothetical protein